MAVADPQKGFHIFLSYRREGTSAHAGRLHDFLVSGVDDQPGFGDDQIFMDIDTIQPGDDFRDVIAGAVARCDVFLAVIGRQWADVRDAQDRRRLDNPADYVRLEVEAALERKIPVIPVLVDRAEMPTEAELPESISPLIYRNGVELSDKRWRYDVGQLLVSLKRREETARLRAAEERTRADVGTARRPRGASPDRKSDRQAPRAAQQETEELWAWSETPHPVPSNQHEPDADRAPQKVDDPAVLAAARRELHAILTARIHQLEAAPGEPTDVETAPLKRRRQQRPARRRDEDAFEREWAKWTERFNPLAGRSQNERWKRDVRTVWESLRTDERLLLVTSCKSSQSGGFGVVALTNERLIVAGGAEIHLSIQNDRIARLQRTGGVLALLHSSGNLDITLKTDEPPVLLKAVGAGKGGHVDEMIGLFHDLGDSAQRE